MNDHDVTAVLERLIEPVEDEVESWDDVLRRAADPGRDARADMLEGAGPAYDRDQALEATRDSWRRRRRVVVLIAAALIAVVGATSALGTVRGFLPILGQQSGPWFNRVVTCKGTRGGFELQMARPWTDRSGVTSRRWKVSSGSGPYAEVTGGGRWRPDVVAREGSELWIARLWGTITAGGTKQRVLITLEGSSGAQNGYTRPGRINPGTFVLRPLERGPLKPDSGSQRSAVFG